MPILKNDRPLLTHRQAVSADPLYALSPIACAFLFLYRLFLHVCVFLPIMELRILLQILCRKAEGSIYVLHKKNQR